MKILLGMIVLAFSHGPFDFENEKPVLADLSLLKSLNIPVHIENPKRGVGFTYINAEQAGALSEASHLVGRCGAFEVVDNTGKSYLDPFEIMNQVEQAYALEDFYKFLRPNLQIDFKEEIKAATDQVNPNNLRDWVTWLSSYPNRFHRSSQPDRHVYDLKTKLEQLMQGSSLSYEIEMISHRSTPQSSLRLRIHGNSKANEIVVLGGHLDSITQWNPNQAPGADDNASGSANLIETVRILSQQKSFERTIDFFWYAGEEAGLLGSGEIAEEYRNQNKNVIAVLQLDMTLFPGEGEGVIGNVTDNTSSWLRDLLLEINRHYLNVRIVDFACGYGCSDHASWFRRGYSTLMPFEATMRTINRNIHTSRDVISDRLSFEHSAIFSKIAVAFAMELAN